MVDTYKHFLIWISQLVVKCLTIMQYGSYCILGMMVSVAHQEINPRIISRDHSWLYIGQP